MIRNEDLCKKRLAVLYPRLSEKSISFAVEILSRYQLNMLSEIAFAYLALRVGDAIREVESAQKKGCVNISGDIRHQIHKFLGENCG